MNCSRDLICSRNLGTWCVTFTCGLVAVGVLAVGASCGEEHKAAESKSTEAIKPASAEKIELPSPPKEIEASLLRLHNEARTRRGAAPLKSNPRLNAAAQRFADFLQRSGRFGHFSDGRSPNQRIQAEGYGTASWAENIAWSQTTPEGAMSTWMNSSGHRGNILSGHTQVGFGQAGSVWVTVFANPAGN